MATVWAILLGGAVGMSSWIAHRDTSQRLLSNLRQGIERDSSEIQLRTETWIQGFQEDARSVSQSPLVSEFLERHGTPEEPRWRALLENEFRSVFAGKPAYFQIRLLSASDADDGKEIVRLDRKDGRLEVTPRELLQSKAGRSYYQEALDWPPGDVYLSEINLNRDFGGISNPHIPTVRAAVKIGSPNSGEAMLIINADLRSLFDDLHRLLSPASEIRLVDGKGDYLLHPDANALFASDLDPGTSLDRAQTNSGAADSISRVDGWQPASRSSPELTFINHISLGSSPPRSLASIVSLPEKAWRADLRHSQWRGIWTTVLAALAGAGVAILVSLPFSSRLRRLSSALREFDAHEGIEDTPLTDNRSDEIGIAIDRFREMKLKVRDQVERLKSAHAEAREANATKEAFLATMSHEIRTPMNAVVGLIRALEDNDPPAHQQPILNSLRSSASNLVILLNTVLDYTRLREGTLQFVCEEFDAAQLVREVVQSLSPAALGKQLDLQMKAPDSLLVQGDPVRLRQVLNNLLTNALKFTTEGFVSVALEHQNGLLKCSVTDSGPGVQAEDRDRIFTPFVSLEHGDSQLETGAGLGLSVSRDIVEQQGGDLILESESTTSGGARFVVKLPYPRISKSKQEGVAGSPAHQASRVPRNLKILYVEDVISNQEVMALTLGSSGVTLTLAGTGAEALEKLSRKSFDLVMVDLQLPDIQGDELARRIIADHPQVPIVAVTAQSSAKTDRRLREAGIRAVATKPYTREEIFELIAAQTKSPSAIALERLHPDNPERARKLAATMATELRNAAGELSQMRHRADDSQCAADIETIRHKLKTAISRFELHDLEQLLERLTQAPDHRLLLEAVESLESAALELDLLSSPLLPTPAGARSREAST